MQQTLLDPHFPALVLAAGASTRLGRSKQMLNTGDGNTLLDIAIGQARRLSPDVWAVVGAGYPLLRYRSQRAPRGWWFNERWREGLSGSLSEGLSRLPPHALGAFVLLADQPFLEVEGLDRLGQQARDDPRCPAAARYGDRVGVPVWLPRALWPACRSLSGDEGAGKILNRFPVQIIDIAGVALDIDTPADWRVARQRLAEQA